mmetsp:Transcript_62674/g.152570  ORF Transcript_62674/g.152570 Transcript_62674/m.152570 type:complete len:146 (+) Transcript_62674:768-1205(+)
MYLPVGVPTRGMRFRVLCTILRRAIFLRLKKQKKLKIVHVVTLEGKKELSRFYIDLLCDAFVARFLIWKIGFCIIAFHASMPDDCASSFDVTLTATVYLLSYSFINIEDDDDDDDEGPSVSIVINGAETTAAAECCCDDVDMGVV